MTLYQIIVNGRVRDTSGNYSTAQSVADKYEKSGCSVEIKEIKK